MSSFQASELRDVRMLAVVGEGSCLGAGLPAVLTAIIKISIPFVQVSPQGQQSKPDVP